MANEEILVIEDDPKWQRELKRILEEKGYKVTIAATPSKAIAALERGTAKLAVVDLSLIPGDIRDRQGQEIMELARIPVVCVSGTMAPCEGKGLFQEGLVKWYFAKRELADQIDSLLAQVADLIRKPDPDSRKKWEKIIQMHQTGD